MPEDSEVQAKAEAVADAAPAVDADPTVPAPAEPVADAALPSSDAASEAQPAAVVEGAVAAAEDVEEVEISLPTRRRRASDDEGDGDDFHDAKSDEDASSHRGLEVETKGVVSAHPVDWGDEEEEEEEEEDADKPADGSKAAAAEEGQEEGDADQEDAGAKKAKPREPFEVPTQGAFWLHDDRFDEAEAAAYEEMQRKLAEERKARSDTQGRWQHDRFGVEVPDDEARKYFVAGRGRGRGRGGFGGRGPAGGLDFSAAPASRRSAGEGPADSTDADGGERPAPVGRGPGPAGGRRGGRTGPGPVQGRGRGRGRGGRGPPVEWDDGPSPTPDSWPALSSGPGQGSRTGAGDGQRRQERVDRQDAQDRGPRTVPAGAGAGGRGRGAGYADGDGPGAVRGGRSGGRGDGGRDGGRGRGAGGRGRGDSSAAPGANSWPPLPSQHDQGGAGGDAEQPARGPRRYTQSRPGAQQGDGGAQGAGSKGGLSVEAQEYVPPAGNRGKAPVAQQQQYNGNSGGYGARQPQGQGQGHQGKQEYGGGFSSGAAPAPAAPAGYAPQQQFGGQSQGWNTPVAPNAAPPMAQSGPQPAPMYPTIPVMPPHVQMQQGEALVVAMAQQAAQQYNIIDPAVIAWLQGGLRQAMECGASPQQAFTNMHAYLQQHMYSGQQPPQQVAAPHVPQAQPGAVNYQAAPQASAPQPAAQAAGGGRRYMANRGH